MHTRGISGNYKGWPATLTRGLSGAWDAAGSLWCRKGHGCTGLAASCGRQLEATRRHPLQRRAHVFRVRV